MKLEVGMYARVQELNEVTIVKILKVEDDGFNADSNMFYMFSEVIKASHNIIDLIEIGDYVNGHEVMESNIEDNQIYLSLDINVAYYGSTLEVTNEDIKTILTKEQMENYQYVIK